MIWRMGFREALAAVALLVAQPALADDLADALALPVASELTGAKDVPRFAWVERAAGVRNIWVADAGQPARQITGYREDDGQLLADLAFSRDGQALAFVRGGDDEFPDEEDLPNTGSALAVPRQQVLVATLDGTAPVAIGDGHSPVFDPSGKRLAYTRRGAIWLWERGAEARKIATVTGEVGRLQWSPDGKRLLFVDSRGDHGFVALLDIAEARLRYLDPGLGSAVEPAFSPNGRDIAFIRFVEPPAGARTGASPDEGAYWSIRVADVETGKTRTLWTAPQGMGGRYAGTRGRNLFWSEDGQIVFPWERTGWLHPYAIDPAGGGTPRDLTPGAFEVETFLLDASGRSLIYAANAGNLNRRHVYRRQLDAGTAQAITSGDGIESYPTLGGETLAVIATDASHPAYPALAGRQLGPLAKRTASTGYSAPEAVTFRAEDGVEVHAQLFRARGPGRHPAAIFVHGGPRRQMLLGFHPSGYYSNAYILNQHLAARGYDVLSVNYRGGTGYGLAFRDAAGTGRDGATEYRDILAAGRWLAAQTHVDPGRIGIWGGSWGGYLTALALARDSALFAAGVDFHGVHTLLRTVPNTLSPADQIEARELQWQSSPMSAIDRWRSPALLIHGDDDRNVDFSQSLLLARELAARRIPYRDIAFPNERHSFFRHAPWLESYRATVAFFDEALAKPAP